MLSEFETAPIQIIKLERSLRLQGCRFAFSRESRREIGQRAGWASEQSGKSFHEGYMVHAAHLNHDKSNPDYDNPNNGILLTVDEHLEQHIAARGRAGEIGLCEAANDWAIRKLEQTPRLRR